MFCASFKNYAWARRESELLAGAKCWCAHAVLVNTRCCLYVEICNDLCCFNRIHNGRSSRRQSAWQLSTRLERLKKIITQLKCEICRNEYFCRKFLFDTHANCWDVQFNVEAIWAWNGLISEWNLNGNVFLVHRLRCNSNFNSTYNISATWTRSWQKRQRQGIKVNDLIKNAIA